MFFNHKLIYVWRIISASVYLILYPRDIFCNKLYLHLIKTCQVSRNLRTKLCEAMKHFPYSVIESRIRDLFKPRISLQESVFIT